MIGLDSNVLIRYIAQDDAAQSGIANRLIEKTLSAEHPGFISTIVLCELVWVLEGASECAHAEVVQVLDRLLRARPFVIERAEAAWQAKQMFATGKADFADCLIERTGSACGCDHTVTFDRTAARDAGMRLADAGHV